jgi:hypothetical protein
MRRRLHIHSSCSSLFPVPLFVLSLQELITGHSVHGLQNPLKRLLLYYYPQHHAVLPATAAGGKRFRVPTGCNPLRKSRIKEEEGTMGAQRNNNGKTCDIATANPPIGITKSVLVKLMALVIGDVPLVVKIA